MKSKTYQKKPYFAIIQENEFEMEATPAERLVFFAIKSFSANGKRLCKESYLSISKRAGVSDVWTKNAVLSLEEKGKISIEGKTTKRGGSCPNIKVLTHLELSLKSSNSVRTLKKSSSNSVRLSSNSVKKSEAKKRQSNKVIHTSKQYLKNIPTPDLGIFKEKFGFSKQVIKDEGERAFDWLASKGVKRKNYKAFFRNWLRNKFDRQKENEVSIEGKDIFQTLTEETAKDKARRKR